ncbi:hypothetical protein [Peribacillus butanolivorans]|uniref:Plasmid segregation centromere-binding protein ParR n=1 Tax=Peribacillus butanolivorans TaxID=421767 RepID=A0AAX0S071_9BACI|nr:hypothetical protein [Peribacillus butanolivorans]AXN38938.1 hypothetical protein DTO10_11260 [Peribacillus butanolivorans]KON66784.1 hypothetical protein AKG34_22505 [Peribacillus butanolivorans]PEJ30060.1 hypothetical protein CN689_19910 [Peribacillus butanolivorans]QNU02584.1 hypothetical protein GM240_00450 [Peribacillus butanolivorans]
MKKTASSEIKRGQAITFRIPSDVSDYTLRQLQKLKETERRNFSSKIAEYVLDGIGQSTHQEREMIALPMPNKLSKSQRDWLKHSHSEAMLGTIMYHLLSDPLRATALLASLNSNVINEEIYLQDEPEEQDTEVVQKEISKKDLDDFDWSLDETTQQVEEPEPEEENLDDLLGDFLDQMNQ